MFLLGPCISRRQLNCRFPVVVVVVLLLLCYYIDVEPTFISRCEENRHKIKEKIHRSKVSRQAILCTNNQMPSDQLFFNLVL